MELEYIKLRETKMNSIKKKLNLYQNVIFYIMILLIFTLLLITKYIKPYKYNNDAIERLISLLYSSY